MMLQRLRLAHLAITLAAAIAVGCGGDQALLVTPRPGNAPPLGVVADPNGATIHPVHREQPLAGDEAWSFDVGPEGTTVRYPSVGLTITVPPGAVDATTRITCIALHGGPLAYRFEPHGLQFAQPVQLTQSLRGLRLGKASLGMPPLIAGYFADDSLVTDATTGDARALEILPVQIDVRGHNAVVSIRHFSGYTVASAERDSVDAPR
jgi:hypothetical protein